MNISAAGLQERKEPPAVDTGERKEGPPPLGGG